MNWKTENKPSWNFCPNSSKDYRDNFARVTENPIEKEVKEFKIANCGRCHIKVSTHNGLCPCCSEPVEI